MTKHEKTKSEATAAVKAALINHHHFTESRHGNLVSENGERRYKFQAQVIRVERSFTTEASAYSKAKKHWTRVRSMKYSEVYVDEHHRIATKLNSAKLKGGSAV